MSKFRPAIIRLHEKEFLMRKITNLLDIQKTTVLNDITRYEEMGNYPDCFEIENRRFLGFSRLRIDWAYFRRMRTLP
jgi:hypothetical protein